MINEKLEIGDIVYYTASNSIVIHAEIRRVDDEFAYTKQDKLCRYKRKDDFYWSSPSNLLCWKLKSNIRDIKEESTNKTNIMETRNVKLSLDTAKEWYKNGGELKEVALQAYTENELFPSTKIVAWKDLEELEGYYVTTHSGIITFKGRTTCVNQNIFKTRKQAKSALAMAQISQLLPIYNEGWEPDWSADSNKYCLINTNNTITDFILVNFYNFLAFKSMDICLSFLATNEQLVKEYLMID